jgi:hypothetical protein
MTHMPVAISFPSPLSTFTSRMRTGSPWLYANTIAMLLGCLVCIGLMGFDDRLIHGVNAWNKPFKFFLSLAVQFATVAWAMSLLSKPQRGVATASFIMTAAGWIEMAYIIFRAARGEESHFNVGTPLASALYTIMGVFAVSITASSAFIGFKLWRGDRKEFWAEAAALGLMLGALLGTIAGGYMSSQTSHWVGGGATDAHGLGFFNWSTSGGDLRVAHFVGLHAAQLIPLAALSGRRSVVYGSAAIITIVTAAVFLQALAGMPLLRG